MSGSPIVCRVCSLPALGFKHFADVGWICRSCVLSATRVHAIYLINGIRFVEILKPAPRATAQKEEASA